MSCSSVTFVLIVVIFTIFMFLTLKTNTVTAEDEQNGKAPVSPTYILNTELSEYFSQCFGDLGCLNTDSTWYNSSVRPINLKALDRNIIKTEFLFITKSHANVSNWNSALYKSCIVMSCRIVRSYFSGQ